MSTANFIRKNTRYRAILGRFRLNLNLLGIILGSAAFLFFSVNLSAQCVLGCTQNLQISLDATGHVTITVGLIAPYAAQNCPGTLNLTVFNPAGLPISPILDCTRINQILSVKVEHPATGNICWGSLVVKDYLPPVILGVEKYLFCTQSTAPTNIGFPSVSDNCTPLTSQNLTFTDVQTDLACGSSNNGISVTARIDRTWKATDASANTGFFLQKIWIRRGLLTDVVFPKNLDDIDGAALDCSQNSADLSLTGKPTIAGFPIEISGFCTLSASKTDQTYPICGAVSKKLLRTWQVVDWCANTFLLHVQVIKNLDRKPPNLLAPANLTLATSTNECFRNSITLPTPTVSDDCSAINWAANWPFGTGFGPFQNVPLGEHIISFVATDACANSASCTMKIAVMDQTPPHAICKSDLQITLPTGANSINVSAATFDGGSFDNCSISQKMVSRDGINFGSTINFTCLDVIPTPILVKFKTFDAAGNADFCTATVFLKDFAAPIITCPNNITLECWQDFTHPSVAGTAVSTDNCGQPSLTFSDQSMISVCHEGLINRTWKAVDAGGNSAICLQKITLQKVASTLAVAFPSDKILTSCPAPQTPNLSGFPTWTGHGCDAPLVTFTDTLLNGDSLFCFKIKRNWRVLDQCSYDPSNGSTAGLFQKNQLISVVDGQNPVFLPAFDTIFTTINNCNLPFFVNLKSVTATDCSPFLSITNNSIYAISGGQNASGNYPVGAHQVVFKAVDGCGNSATISQKIEVKCTPPIKISIAGKIATPAGLTVANLDVTCETDGFAKRKKTSASGQFMVDSLQSGATFIVRPTSRKNWTNGINTFDVVLLQRHILNLAPITNPFKLIAADINKNKNVTTGDIVELRKLILGIYDSLPNNNSWRFVPSDYIFLNPAWPFSEAFPEKMVLAAVTENQSAKDFTAIKIGDLNGSVDPLNEFSSSALARGNGDFWPIFMENKDLKAGFKYKIALRSAALNRFDAFQFAAHFDSGKVKILKVLPGSALQESDLNLTKIGDGNVVLSWIKTPELAWLSTDSTLLEWEIECLQDAKIEDIFSFNHDQISAEFYEPDGRILGGDLIFIEPSKSGNPTKMEVHPNPFSSSTTLYFSLESAAFCQFYLMDAVGQILKKTGQNLAKGAHEIEFSEADLPSAGVYFIKMERANQPTWVEKLIYFKN